MRFIGRKQCPRPEFRPEWMKVCERVNETWTTHNSPFCGMILSKCMEKFPFLPFVAERIFVQKLGHVYPPALPVHLSRVFLVLGHLLMNILRLQVAHQFKFRQRAPQKLQLSWFCRAPVCSHAIPMELTQLEIRSVLHIHVAKMTDYECLKHGPVYALINNTPTSKIERRFSMKRIYSKFNTVGRVVHEISNANKKVRNIASSMNVQFM